MHVARIGVINEIRVLVGILEGKKPTKKHKRRCEEYMLKCVTELVTEGVD